MDAIQKNLLEQVAGLHEIPEGAYNIRSDGQLAGRNTTANIDIISKQDKSGIDIYIKPGTTNESVHIPVILSQSGLQELVYNDFHVGENCDVTIIAGCGIHNCGTDTSKHDGVHTFYVGKNSKVRYIERHYGEGDGRGENIMNPQTVVHLEENAYMEMETTQIKGIDSTNRITRGDLKDGATLEVREKIMTHGKQYAKTDFHVELNQASDQTSAPRKSLKDTECAGHSECDAIIMENAHVDATPELSANNIDASLIHEAAIGKIAGDQLIKLMTLGLTEAEAEEQIINGFLK